MTASGHQRTILVWDIPAAVESGSRFAITVGIRCESACRPQSWSLEVYDHGAARVAVAAVAEQTLSGTESVYYTQIPLTAPADVGLFAWRIVAPESGPDAGGAAGHGHKHERTHAEFNVRAVRRADHRLTVIAVDRASQKPVADAKVVVHPYRARTDAGGTVALDLPAGPFRLFVSGRDCFPWRMDGELAEDLTVRAELDLDLGPSDAELWS